MPKSSRISRSNLVKAVARLSSSRTRRYREDIFIVPSSSNSGFPSAERTALNQRGQHVIPSDTAMQPYVHHNVTLDEDSRGPPRLMPEFGGYQTQRHRQGESLRRGRSIPLGCWLGLARSETPMTTEGRCRSTPVSDPLRVSGHERGHFLFLSVVGEISPFVGTRGILCVDR